jgi:carboxyl-terminal processing protease
MLNDLKKKKISKLIIVLVVLAATYGLGFYFGNGKDKNSNNIASLGDKIIAYSENAKATTTLASNEGNFDFNLYAEVWDTIKTNYVDKNKLTDKELFYGSLKGLAAATKDPYTVFMDPTESKEFSDDLAGTFEGIGAEVGMRNDIITIIAPLDGMPAQKAGLLAGDKLYAIDGKSVLGSTVDEAVKKIRGKKGTKVVLTIIRGKDKPKDISIVRNVIIVKSVKTEIRPDGIMVIKVSNFNNDTKELFDQAVALAVVKNPKGIILDLRNNPGGYLDTAVSMASEWVEGGPVVIEQFNSNRVNEYAANGKARLKNFKTIILINGGSASASEIVAGALRDYKKATIIGETSFGKGSVQTLRDLSDGSSLKVTVAKWLTPGGEAINEKGIKPEIEVKITETDINKNLDPQFNKALELLKIKPVVKVKK